MATLDSYGTKHTHRPPLQCENQSQVRKRDRLCALRNHTTDQEARSKQLSDHFLHNQMHNQDRETHRCLCHTILHHSHVRHCFRRPELLNLH